MDTVSKRVSKACDACKLRKVKCSGQEPCRQCSHLNLKCIFSAVTTKRAQGKRGRIISEYKSKTTNTNHPPPLLNAAGSVQQFREYRSLECSPATPLDAEHEHNAVFTQQAATMPQYSQSFFLSLIPDYMDMVYPVHPVIPESELRVHIQAIDSNQEMRSFIYAFGACTLNLTRFGDKRTEQVSQDIEILMNLSIQYREPPYASLRPSVISAVQSGFLHNCLMTIQASDAAFYYIRDAISRIQLLRIDNSEIMSALAPHERSRRQRLYWQAFIHERFVAILDYRQAILPPLDHLPEDDPTIPISVHEGFNQIIKLFRLLDQDFLRNWLSNQGNVTSAWVEAKSRELEDEDESESRGLALLSNMQRADLSITREWLRTIVWRMAMSQSLLSSRSSKECLSLLFPVRLSNSLRQQVTSMSREDIEVHGSSIVQKLFEITDTIADVLIHVPAATLEETALRIEDYIFILDFVLLFPTLDQTRRGILMEKLERLKSMFPEVYSNHSSPNVPGLLDVRSPTLDPWYHIGQSKIGVDGSAAMAFEATAPPQDVGMASMDPQVTQRAAWNQISRRLSLATFTPIE